MAPTPITKTVPTIDGVEDVAEADLDTVNGNSISDMNPRTIVTVRNNDVAPQDVTFVTSYAVGGLELEDKVVSIPAGETRRFAGFDTKYYGRTMTITGASAELKLQAIQV